MTDGIRVQHETLDTAATDMTATVQAIDDRMDRLDSDLASLRSEWSGDQQESYHAAKARWDGAIDEMRLLLEETHRTVTASNAAYREADARGAARF